MTADPESDSAAEAPPARARLDWIDTIRGGATLLVLLLHSTVILERFDLEPWRPLMAFNNLFAPYRMALLMLLAGLLLDRALRKDAAEFTRRKVETLLYPFLLWTAAYGMVVHEPGLTDPRLWIGESYLWFILFLFSYFMVGLAARAIPVEAVIVASVALSLLAPDDTKYLERYFFLMSLFFIGQYLGRRPARLDGLSSARLLPWALPVMALLSLASLASGGLNYKAELLPAVLAGIAVLLHLARRTADGVVVPRLNFIGRHSVVFFVLHYPVMYVVTGISLEAGVASVPVVTGLSFGVTLLACCWVAALRERNRALDWAFVLPSRRGSRRRSAA